MVVLIADTDMIQSGRLAIVQFFSLRGQDIGNMNRFEKINGRIQRH